MSSPKKKQSQTIIIVSLINSLYCEFRWFYYIDEMNIILYQVHIRCTQPPTCLFFEKGDVYMEKTWAPIKEMTIIAPNNDEWMYECEISLSSVDKGVFKVLGDEFVHHISYTATDGATKEDRKAPSSAATSAEQQSECRNLFPDGRHREKHGWIIEKIDLIIYSECWEFHYKTLLTVYVKARSKKDWKENRREKNIICLCSLSFLLTFSGSQLVGRTPDPVWMGLGWVVKNQK